MKIKILILCVLLCLLTSCKNTDTNDLNALRYDNLKNNLLTNRYFSSNSKFYDLNIEINKIKDNDYRFYMIIDNPKIAMHNIQALVMVDDLDIDNEFAANYGIFENQRTNMIPYQYDIDKNYLKGIIISGSTKKANPKFRIIVSYQNELYTKNHIDYIYKEIN